MRLFKHPICSPRLYESDTGSEQREKLLQVYCLALSHRQITVPAGFCTLQEVGLAMIKVAVYGYRKQILEVKDIVALAIDTQVGS